MVIFIFIAISISILVFIINETKKQKEKNMTESERNDIKQVSKFKGDIKITKKKCIIISVIVIVCVFILGDITGYDIEVTAENKQTAINATLPATPAVTSDASTAEPAVTTPTADPTWQTVQTFTGSNITRTAPFTIDAGVTQWRITWSTTPGSMGDMNFIADLDDTSGNMVDSIANCVGAGNSVINETAPGDYTLDINTSQQYTITIEELK